MFIFKKKTAYDMRISDWSSDVCSSDLRAVRRLAGPLRLLLPALPAHDRRVLQRDQGGDLRDRGRSHPRVLRLLRHWRARRGGAGRRCGDPHHDRGGHHHQPPSLLPLLGHHHHRELDRMNVDLPRRHLALAGLTAIVFSAAVGLVLLAYGRGDFDDTYELSAVFPTSSQGMFTDGGTEVKMRGINVRSEEHTSELQSLMRRSYAVFC